MTFILAYLKSRKRKARIGLAFSDYLNISFRDPKECILDSILVIIFLSDLFYIYNDLDYASYVDDTISYICRQNHVEAIEFSELTINNIFFWFKYNGIVANSGKSNFLVSLYEKISLKILGSTFESSPREKLLAIAIDSELTFHKHIISLYSKANQKLSILAKIAKYLTIDKRKILLISFITAQINYCLLIWICHSRTLNNKINRIQERALRIDYNNKFHRTSREAESLLYNSRK